MVKAAVMGYGTVGSGVVEVIEKNKRLIKNKSITKKIINFYFWYIKLKILHTFI